MKNLSLIVGCLAVIGGVYYFAYHSRSAHAAQVQQKVEVVIYGSDNCRYCKLAKQLLEKQGIKYTDKDVAHSTVRTEMGECTNNARTIPQILVGKKHIGGYTQLQDLIQSGQLDKMLAGN